MAQPFEFQGREGAVGCEASEVRVEGFDACAPSLLLDCCGFLFSPPRYDLDIEIHNPPPYPAARPARISERSEDAPAECQDAF